MRITLITTQEVRPSSETKAVLRDALDEKIKVLDWTGIDEGTVIRLHEDGSHEMVSPDEPWLVFRADPHVG